MSIFPEPCHHELYGLERATVPGLEWPALHAQAIALGCGAIVTVAEERVAGADELLAHAPRELVLLGELAAFTSLPVLAEDCRQPLEHAAAGLLRVLDRALLAHGRDLGYRVDAWREHVTISAATVAAMINRRADGDTWPLPASLLRVAARIADAQLALRRDRLGVPEHLVDAVSELLVVYAAAAQP